MKILLIAGARPNFMKIAPLVHELKRVQSLQNGNESDNHKEIIFKVVDTGQHYDYEMSSIFFEDFDLPKPDYFLNSGSGTHGQQTARIMVEFEKVCFEEKPDLVVVVGDVNSTLACSITAKKLNIKVAHVEAGLRSFDMTMPEEINRIVTDTLADFLFVTEKSGIENLKKEAKSEDKIFFVGNIMIDTLFYCLEKLKNTKPPKNTNFKYGVLTLHRPSNVDDKDKLKDILDGLVNVANDMVIYFPIHPRTKNNLEKFGLDYWIDKTNIKIIPPLSYIEFLDLWKDANFVFTDSGGIQEETTVLGIPCFTIRENTERPITIEQGTNILVGTTGKEIIDAYIKLKVGDRKKGTVPELWDGKTAERIVKIINESKIV